ITRPTSPAAPAAIPHARSPSAGAPPTSTAVNNTSGIDRNWEAVVTVTGWAVRVALPPQKSAEPYTAAEAAARRKAVTPGIYGPGDDPRPVIWRTSPQTDQILERRDVRVDPLHRFPTRADHLPVAHGSIQFDRH